MEKKTCLLTLTSLLLLGGCSSPASKEEVISLYSASSRYYLNSLKEEDSCALPTYRHKKYGDVPYVRLSDYCAIFPKTSVNGERDYKILDGKFIVSNNDFGSFVFDAEKDTVTASSDVLYFFKDSRRINNVIPLDIYVPDNFERFVKGSPKTRYVRNGKERVYECGKYSFDIVYEKGDYYAPFSLLTSLFFEYGNETAIYNGKDFFDGDYLFGESPSVQYCYSSKGNFLLDLSGGKLGPSIYENKTPEAGEEYHFETTIEASGQRFVFSLANGTGFINSYNKDGKLIEEDVYKKVKYERKGDLLILRYFSVFDPKDDEKDAVSDVYTLTVHLDETNFMKGVRSQEVADFTYQELRFAMYALYGKTRNKAVKDFDKFIEDKPYKENLLSTDIKKYDEAMAKFLLQGVDDCHTSIETTSLYGTPTMANANSYTTTLSGERYEKVTSEASTLRALREQSGVKPGLDIVGETAVLSFDKFEFSRNKDKVASIKAFSAYEGTKPEDYVNNDTMEFFASSFNQIAQNKGVKNVVIDLTCNTGGKTATMGYLTSYLSKDPFIYINKGMNDAVIEYHYLADLNQDGVYGSDLDSFQGKYKFYVLTSPASFSCGTHLPNICQDNKMATMIGETSAGGSCSISYLSNATGYLYHSSSLNIAVTRLQASDCVDPNNPVAEDAYVDNDNGISPEIPLDRSYWYDHSKLDAFLKGRN